MRTQALLAALAAALAGCTVSFDPNRLACDAHRQCLAGYVCDPHNQCVPVGGSGATSTSGSSGTTGRTTSGASSGGTSGSFDCARVGCPFEERCVVPDAGGAGACVPSTFACEADGGCASGVCLSGATGPGFCSAPCTAGSACPAGQFCDTGIVGSRGNVTGRCLPSEARACVASRSCSAPYASCVPFQAPGLSDPSLPAGFCEQPPPGGIASGGRCTSDRDCASGLCAASSGGAGVCLDACADTLSDCATLGSTCTEVRLLTGGRIVRACASTATTCQPCGSCGADAPDCDAAGRCVLFCNPNDDAACGPGPRTCITSGATGGSACSGPDGGAC